MTQKAFAALPSRDQLHFYRCPACGEMVDKRQLEEIVLHHSHVLHRGHYIFQRPWPSRSSPVLEGNRNKR